MKAQEMAMAASVQERTEGDAVATVMSKSQTTLEEGTLARSGLGESRFAPVAAPVRMHTLVLAGELDRTSVHALEAEIERLCEEGVSGITLDLSELKYIDSIGVAVIAFRCGLCERRGYDFALIPGSRFVQRAFLQAGLAGALPFRDGEVAAHPPSALLLGSRSRDDCDQ